MNSNALRDQYAGDALSSCKVMMEERAPGNVSLGMLFQPAFTPQELAKRCFDVAEAMIAEREKRGTK